ncbi:MAG: hypothetical protein AAFW89_04055 [Bacteroidota bacterium]
MHKNFFWIPLLFVLLLVGVKPLNAQPGTEIYVFDFVKTDSGYVLLNPVNISDNPGYDNQPSFSEDNSGVYFTSTRNGQTDLRWYELETGTTQWLTDTPEGSEYSPTPIPGLPYVSAIFLHQNGKQTLQKYPTRGGSASLLIDEVVVGYHNWIDANTLFSFVLPDSIHPSTFQMHTIDPKSRVILGENPGRSFHKVPGDASISYINKANNPWTIESFNPENNHVQVLAEVINKSEDFCWTPQGELLTGDGSVLKLYRDRTWQNLADVSAFNLTNITRLAVSQNGRKIALTVSE